MFSANEPRDSNIVLREPQSMSYKMLPQSLDRCRDAQPAMRTAPLRCDTSDTSLQTMEFTTIQKAANVDLIYGNQESV